MVARNTKFSLLSPYFSYFETMPSKNSKDLVQKTLLSSLEAMQVHLESVVSKSDCEPATKRQKIERPSSDETDKYSRSQRISKMLQKQGALAVGMKECAKALAKKAG